jgi:hypothetical protein
MQVGASIKKIKNNGTLRGASLPLGTGNSVTPQCVPSLQVGGVFMDGTCGNHVAEYRETYHVCPHCDKNGRIEQTRLDVSDYLFRYFGHTGIFRKAMREARELLKNGKECPYCMGAKVVTVRY